MLTLTLPQLCAVGAVSCFFLGLIDGVARRRFNLSGEKRAFMLVGFGAGCTSLPRTVVMVVEKSVAGCSSATLALGAFAGAAMMIAVGERAAGLF